jgi:hypothetical protein
MAESDQDANDANRRQRGAIEPAEWVKGGRLDYLKM